MVTFWTYADESGTTLTSVFGSGSKCVKNGSKLSVTSMVTNCVVTVHDIYTIHRVRYLDTKFVNG